MNTGIKGYNKWLKNFRKYYKPDPIMEYMWALNYGVVIPLSKAAAKQMNKYKYAEKSNADKT